MISKGPQAHLSGLREAYFGELLQSHTLAASAEVDEYSLDHIVRFVEAFEVSLSAKYHSKSIGLEGLC